MKITNYEKKEMVLLTDKEIESYEKQKVCYICKAKFTTDKNDEDTLKKNIKSETIVITQENVEEPLIIFVI